MSKEFIIDGNIGGYIDENGHFEVIEEYGLTDRDSGRYDVDVQNGKGYYNSDGWFVRNYDFYV